MTRLVTVLSAAILFSFMGRSGPTKAQYNPAEAATLTPSDGTDIRAVSLSPKPWKMRCAHDIPMQKLSADRVEPLSGESLTYAEVQARLSEAVVGNARSLSYGGDGNDQGRVVVLSGTDADRAHRPEWEGGTMTATRTHRGESSVAANPWSVTLSGMRGEGDFAFDYNGRASYAHRTINWPYALKYAVQEPIHWSEETVASDYSIGTWFPDLTYAPDGAPGVAHSYFAGMISTARYTFRLGQVWDTERVSPGEGEFASLAYAPDGRACMVYLNTDSPSGTGWTADYAERTGSDSWSVESAASARYVAFGHKYSLVFLPETGQPAISFLYGFDTDDPPELRTAELRYAYRDEGVWHVEVVDDSSPFVGFDSEMLLDPQGKPAICYQDATNDQLKFARRIGPDDWDTQIVDSDGDVGRFSTLVFLPDGRPAIAYADMTNHDLKYSAWRDEAWHIRRIAEGKYGYYCRMELDENGRPRVMFTDSQDQVYQAVFIPGNWDGDPDVDLVDFIEFPGCFSGPWQTTGFVVPSHDCLEVFDFDADSDVDLPDFSEFTKAFSTLIVEAGALEEGEASAGTYFSNGNDLSGSVVQSGFNLDDFSILWEVELQPPGSGYITIFTPSTVTSPYVIEAPALSGEYVFRLTAANTQTGEAASDTVALSLVEP